MFKAKGLVLKDGKLERIPSLLPTARVAFLIDEEEKCELTPVSTLYQNMEFPIGVFNRAYEELHYLDMILCKAASAHIAQVSFERESVARMPERMAVIDSTFQHLTSQDWVGQAAKGYPANTLAYQRKAWEQQHSVADAALGLNVGDAAKKFLEESNVRSSVLGHSVQDSIAKFQRPVAGELDTQYAEIKIKKDTLPNLDNSMQHIFAETKRLRAEQQERDERQRKQTEYSEEQLRLHTEQIKLTKLLQEKQSEDAKRLEEKQMADSKRTNRIAVIALIVSGVGVLFTIIGTFI